jgi:hypothetical protein
VKKSVISLFLLCSLISKSEASMEGFREYLIRKGDTLSKIAPSAYWEIIEKVNKIDSRHLIPGRKILIPEGFEKAKEFCPVPQKINNESERILYFFLDVQYFGAYERGNLILWGPISSGRRNSTPLGIFRVNWKKKDYISKKYKMPMPYAVNFSERGYFFHQQSLPGRPASHGCIRLLMSDAKKLFYWIKRGDPVMVTTLKDLSEAAAH